MNAPSDEGPSDVIVDFDEDVGRFFPTLSADLVDYLVNVSLNLGYVYVENPKVASSTIKSMLQLAEVGGHAALLARMRGNVHRPGHSHVAPSPPLTGA